MTPLTLARQNLQQQVMRTLISLLGIGFAVLLIFMQEGFRDSVSRTATLLYDQLEFDLLLVSSEYISLAKPSAFPRRRLSQSGALHEVQASYPLTTVLGLWRDPRPTPDDPDGPRHQWSILVLAVDPASLPELFRQPIGTIFLSEEEFYEDMLQLSRIGTVLIDRSSRAEYGNREIWVAEPRNELNGRQIEIIGTIKIGTGFAYNGLLMTSETTLERSIGFPGDQISFGLIKLAPGSDVEKVRDQMQRMLPEDVKVHTRDSINKVEKTFWMEGTAVGQFFTVGVFIALFVGGVFVYQMMAADIARRLPEYATIRALGYPSHFLTRIVYWQGFLLALIGFVPGLLAALLCYQAARVYANIPIVMTLDRVALVFALTVAMCMGSSLVAVRAVRRADPADLF